MKRLDDWRAPMHIRRKLPLRLLACLTACFSIAPAAPPDDWQTPVMRRAVLWLLYDDWGQEGRSYGSERIESTAHDRQKPASLIAGKTIFLDASGWGTRAPFLYHSATKTVTAAPPGYKPPERHSESISISIEKQPAYYTAKLYWGHQLFFLALQFKNGQPIVTEFSEHMVMLRPPTLPTGEFPRALRPKQYENRP
jgi:hypothetical protein